SATEIRSRLPKIGGTRKARVARARRICGSSWGRADGPRLALRRVARVFSALTHAKGSHVMNPRNFLSSSLACTFFALGLSLPAAGCGNAELGPSETAGERSGDVALELDLAPGATLTSVSSVITGPAGFSRTGSINVGMSTKISAIIGGIPAGMGY